MNNKHKEIVIVLLFFLLSIFVFRDYFLKNTVPFPANLLVSFYQPWASYNWEGYPNGPPNKPIGFDNLRIFYPLRSLTIDQIKNLEMPLWNPYNFSGNTLLATYQSAVFHPFSFLFFLLPQIDAWSLIIILTPFLASYFMYLFLRELFLSRKAAIFGAIVFAFSGFMIVWIEESFMSSYSALFLPLVLFGIQRAYRKIDLLGFISIVFGLAFSILSGWFQMSFYVWIFSLLWIVVISLKENHKNKINLVFYFLSSLFLAITISAVHLFPSVEAYFNSARGSTDAKFIFETYLVPIYHLVTFLAPDFFGNPGAYNYIGNGFYYEKVIFIGIPALIFALYELIQFKNVNYKENFFKLFFLITLSLGFALPTSWFILYHLKIPFLSVVLPSRIFFLSALSLSVLSAFGINRFLKEVNKKKIFIILAFLGVLFVTLFGAAFFYKVTSDISNKYALVPIKNLALPSIIYFISFFLITLYLRNKKYITIFYLGIIFVTFLSSAYFANKYLYFSDRKLIFPQTPVLNELGKISGIDRFWGIGRGYIDRNFATYYRLFSAEGYDSFYIRRYGELFYAAQNNGKYSTEIQRADAKLTDVENLDQLLGRDLYRRKLMNLLGIKYLITDSKKQVVNSGFELKWKDNKFSIYEDKSAMPRIFMVEDYKVINSPQKIMDAIFDKKTDLTKTVILEEKPSISLEKNNEKNGEVKVISYKPNKIVFKTKSNVNSILFLSDNYYPGWKAYIDNLETKIYRADYSFRAITLPKGEHDIIFEYRPSSFYSGLIISVIGLLLSFIFAVTLRRGFLKI